MPRDGSNIYHYPVGIEGEPNQTIQSAPYNSFLSDVEQDLNAARPILAGGTGATSADAALAALGGEKAGQIVTNYDSFAFVAGSFYSTSSATGGPVGGQAFAGICYVMDNNNYFIEARSFVNGNIYARGKVAGVWGAWVNSDATLDAAKVNRTGDTMTGTLQINGAAFSRSLVLHNNTAPGYEKTIRLGNTSELEIVNSANNAVIMTLTDAGALTAASTLMAASLTSNSSVLASNGIYYFNSAGTRTLQYDGTNFHLNGGMLFVQNNAQINGTLTANATSGAGALNVRNATNDTNKYMRTSTAASLEFINNAFNAVIATLTDSGYWTCQGGLSNGEWQVNGDIVARYGTNQGTIRFGQGGSGFYLTCDGSNYHFGTSNTVNAANFNATNNLSASGSVSGAYVTSSGNVNANNNLTCGADGAVITGYAGSGNPWQVNALRFDPNWNNIQIMGLHYSGTWAGIRMNGGGISFDFRMNDSSAHKTSGAITWVIDSDARVKTVTGDYTHGLDAIAALRPVTYRYKRNQSFDSPEAQPKLTDNERYNIEHQKTIEYTGLVAQQAEGAMPELFTRETAYIDGKKVEDMRTAEYTPLIFALVNAVKELKARVEELEAR